MDELETAGTGDAVREEAEPAEGGEVGTAEPWVLDGEIKSISEIGRVVVALLVMQIVGAMLQVWSSILQLRLLESLQRAYGNLAALDYRAEHSPGWAIGAWFVPFLNLVRPFSILREIYVASSPEREKGDPVIPTAPAVMGVWWAAWLIGGFIEQGIMRMDSETLGEIEVVTQATIISTAVSMLGAGLAALIVHRITARQGALITRLSDAPTTF